MLLSALRRPGPWRIWMLDRVMLMSSVEGTVSDSIMPGTGTLCVRC
jgi:hypothetical protein